MAQRSRFVLALSSSLLVCACGNDPGAPAADAGAESTPDGSLERDASFDTDATAGDGGGDAHDATAPEDADGAVSTLADASIHTVPEAPGVWKDPGPDGVCKGDFALAPTGLASVTLVTLEQLAKCVEVTGDLDVNPPSAVAPKPISFPLLARVGHQLSVYGNAASSYLFSALTYVGASLYIRNNPKLTQISFPALAAVRGSLLILDGTTLTEVSVPKLSSTGGLTLQRNAALVKLELPNLGQGGVYMGMNTLWSTFSAPKLTTIKNSFYLDTNPALTTLALEALRTVQAAPQGVAFSIKNNKALLQCRAEALRDQLTQLVGSAEISGNAAGACP